MNEKQIHLSDIILSSFFTLTCVGMGIFLAEKLKLIPFIEFEQFIYFNGNIYPSQKVIMSPGESILFLLILIEIIWIVSHLIYWKIRKFKVIL